MAKPRVGWRDRYRKPLQPMIHGTGFLGIVHSISTVEFDAAFGRKVTPVLAVRREQIWIGARALSALIIANLPKQ